MEANQKRGFFRGVAKSFSRVTKRPTNPQQCGTGSSSSKVSPCPPSNTYSADQNLANNSTSPRVCTYSYTSSNQPITSFHEPKSVPSSVQKVSNYVKPPSFYDQTWGPADQNVDSKATNYISNVRERYFKLDRVDSAGNSYQEMI